MDLLEFARGPALQVSLAIFVFGVIWRLLGMLLLPWRRDHSLAREGAPPSIVAAMQGNIRQLWPHKTFVKASAVPVCQRLCLAYRPCHCGLPVRAAYPLLQEPFRRDLARAAVEPHLCGWRDHASSRLSQALVHRLTSPVLKLISRVDDYISWLVTLLPVATGLPAIIQVGARYETLLALHILSICLLSRLVPVRQAHARLHLRLVSRRNGHPLQT